MFEQLKKQVPVNSKDFLTPHYLDMNFLGLKKLMVQKINPHPAPGCNRSPPPPYYVFSKDAILGSVPSISSKVLDLFNGPL